MARSYKKTPITGNVGCKSEKKDKSLANRMERRKVKELIDSNEFINPDKKILFNKYDMGKDGKNYFNPGLHPKEMRK